MKPHEEAWEADEMGCVYLRGARRIATFAYNGQTNVETGDGAHARARLAAQAPAMARALLEAMTPEQGDPTWGCPFCGLVAIHGHMPECTGQSALRDAGVIP